METKELTIEDVLSPDIRANLSTSALILFWLLWKQMNRRKLNQIVLTAREITQRTALSIPKLKIALLELSSEGLMNVTERDGVIIFSMIDQETAA